MQIISMLFDFTLIAATIACSNVIISSVGLDRGSDWTTADCRETQGNFTGRKKM